jgi:hypothetical protein
MLSETVVAHNTLRRYPPFMYIMARSHIYIVRFQLRTVLSQSFFLPTLQSLSTIKSLFTNASRGEIDDRRMVESDTDERMMLCSIPPLQ